MKRLLLVLSFGFALTSISAFADINEFRQRLNQCDRYDSVCTANILLDAIAANSSGPGNPGRGRTTVIEFYRSDNCSSSFLTSVRFTQNIEENQKLCNTLTGSVNSFVWAIKVNGECKDIPDTYFQSVCLSLVGY